MASDRPRCPALQGLTNLARVSVVIPNLNGAHHLKECLDALQRQTFKDFEVVVVDNGSTDVSAALLRASFPWVRVLEMKTNVGFARACNAGIESSDSEFVVLLNNDTRAEPDYLHRFVSAMYDVPQADFAASRMLRYEPPHLIDSAGDYFSLANGQGRSRGEGCPSEGFLERCWVLSAKGGSALYRRSMLNKIGGLDDDFFYIFEDVDVGLRATIAGLKCLYVPEAVVYHKGGISSTLPIEARTIALRNKIWTAGKNLSWPLLGLWFAYAAIRGLRIARHVLAHRFLRVPPSSKDPLHLVAYLQACADALVRLPSKRRSTRKLNVISSRELYDILRHTMRPLTP